MNTVFTQIETDTHERFAEEIERAHQMGFFSAYEDCGDQNAVVSRLIPNEIAFADTRFETDPESARCVVITCKQTHVTVSQTRTITGKWRKPRLSTHQAYPEAVEHIDNLLVILPVAKEVMLRWISNQEGVR